MNSLKSLAMNWGPFQNDLDVGLGHRLDQIPMNQETAVAVQDAAQVVERRANIQAEAPARHRDPRSAVLPPNAASEWRPSLPACSASVVSSRVRSVILTEERFLHFQLRQDTMQSQTTFPPYDVLPPAPGLNPPSGCLLSPVKASSENGKLLFEAR